MESIICLLISISHRLRVGYWGNRKFIGASAPLHLLWSSPHLANWFLFCLRYVYTDVEVISRKQITRAHIHNTLAAYWIQYPPFGTLEIYLTFVWLLEFESKRLSLSGESSLLLLTFTFEVESYKFSSNLGVGRRHLNRRYKWAEASKVNDNQCNRYGKVPQAFSWMEEIYLICEQRTLRLHLEWRCGWGKTNTSFHPRVI